METKVREIRIPPTVAYSLSGKLVDLLTLKDWKWKSLLMFIITPLEIMIKIANLGISKVIFEANIIFVSDNDVRVQFWGDLDEAIKTLKFLKLDQKFNDFINCIKMAIALS